MRCGCSEGVTKGQEKRTKRVAIHQGDLWHEEKRVYVYSLLVGRSSLATIYTKMG